MNTSLDRYPALAVLSFMVGILMLSNLAQPASSQRQSGQASSTSSGGHGDHHTAEGWQFAWPQGDAVKGREVFVKLECYSCHEVKGEQFPAPGGVVGPELSVMGPLHDAQYFAEAIINPNAVIEKGKGYEAGDGTSKMPSFNELVTVQEVIDLVAYLKTLKPPVEPPASHGSRSGPSGSHGGH
jgi:mono/diheme cytochrome c family protein